MFVRRREVEPLRLHEPGGYGVLACEVFYSRLRKAAALLRLGGRDEPGALEAGDVVGHAVRALGEEHLRGSSHRVVSERRGDCLLKCRLAVGAAPVVYEHALL